MKGEGVREVEGQVRREPQLGIGLPKSEVSGISGKLSGDSEAGNVQEVWRVLRLRPTSFCDTPRRSDPSAENLVDFRYGV